MHVPEAGARAALAAVIRKDIATAQRLTEMLQVLPADAAYPDAAAQGYALHNIYGALENIFEQVSRTFENHVTDPAQWHRELLTKMFLEIPRIRPAVLPVDLRGFLNDLRGFRQVFRHAYEFELDAVKLALLVRNWNKSRGPLISSLSRFRDNLLGEI